MKKTRLFYLPTLVLVILLLVPGCSDDKKDEPPPEPPTPELPDIPVEVKMEEASVYGLVKTAQGAPLEGVKITTGDLAALTDAEGNFKLDGVATVNKRSVIRFEKSGYFTITRSGIKKDEMVVEVVMHPKGNSSISTNTTFSATSDKTLSVGAMKVEISASTVVKKDGSAYSGTVNADMLYLDPNNESFNEMMPGGDLAGIRSDNSESQLISYGMVEVSLTDDGGNALQLKKEGASVMTFPIPAGMESNPPETIPLWYFNEEAGIWVEEGVARLEGNVYVGEVAHFSWHNLDWPEDRVTLKGKVTNCNGRPVANVKVTVDQTYAYTDSKGDYSVFIPAGTSVTVEVLSKDYGFLPGTSVQVNGQSGGTTVTQNLELECPRQITGRIVNSCGDLPSAFVRCEYMYEGSRYLTIPVRTDAEGRFSLNAPNINGQAVLQVILGSGEMFTRDVTLSGGDVNVPDIDVCGSQGGTENTLVIMPENGSQANVVISSDKIQCMWVDTMMMVMAEDGRNMCVIAVNGYKGEDGTYTGMVTAGNANVLFTTEQCEVDILKKSEYVFQLSVSGAGEYMVMNPFESGNAQILGSLDAQLTLRMELKRDVEEWGELNLSGIPELFTPVQAFVQATYRSAADLIRYSVLGYTGKDRDDYSEVKSRLENAGFNRVVEEEVEEGTIGVGYRKDDVVIVVAYNAEGEQIEGIEDEFNLVVYVGDSRILEGLPAATSASVLSQKVRSEIRKIKSSPEKKRTAIEAKVRNR